MPSSAMDFSGFFGVALMLAWLIWTGRLLWVVTAIVWRQEKGVEPKGRLSASDVQFLRSLHIRP